ncbi:MAG: hypothetical protein ACKOPM_17250 [Novosphingobium sp.]
MRLHRIVLFAAAAVIGACAAQAKDRAPPPQPQPQAYKDLVQCKAIPDPVARLACYDAQVGKLEQAAASGEVVVTDRASVRAAKKGLFGFTLPSLGIFGGGDDDKDEVKSVEGTVAMARQFGYGSWKITLADGSVWEQTDSERLVFDPVKGNPVKISKGALGVYRMNIDGQRAIKVRRVE